MDLTLFEKNMERMMDDFFGRRTRPWWPERRFRTEGFEIGGPAVDLYEEKDDIVVKAELPGMEKDKLDIRMPGMNGLDLQRQLAATQYQIPVVFITARSTRCDLQGLVTSERRVFLFVKARKLFLKRKMAP